MKITRFRVLLAGLAVVAAGVGVAVTSQATSAAGQSFNIYSAKFHCGEFGKTKQPTPATTVEGPVQPGNYQTSINVHNPYIGLTVGFQKKAVLIYAGKAPVTATQFEVPRPPGQLRTADLKPNHGMLIDCQDIRKVLLAGIAGIAAPTFIEGYVVLEVPVSAATGAGVNLDVQALYTSHGYNCSDSTCSAVTREGFAEHVEVIHPTRVDE